MTDLGNLLEMSIKRGSSREHIHALVYGRIEYILDIIETKKIES